MSVTLTTPALQEIEEPTLADLSQALNDLLASEDDATDLWLEHDSGWTLSVVTTGDAFLENVADERDRYWTLGPLPKESLLLLLQMLAAGRIEALRDEPWEEAEG